MGDSRGHWKGDTLVVDTANFSDAPAVIGADENLHVIERFQRIDDQTLRYSFTVEDETLWQRPWGGAIPGLPRITRYMNTLATRGITPLGIL